VGVENMGYISILSIIYLPLRQQTK